MNATPRRRRGCLISALIAVVVLVGGAVLADRAAHAFAQDAAADAVRSRLETSGDVAVDVRGFPFLTQLAGGTLDDVRLRADGAVVDGLAFTDVDVTATGVEIREPRTARTVVARATVPTATIEDALRERSGWDLALSTEGSAFVASGSVLGVPVSVSLTLSPAGAEGLTASVTGATLGGLSVDAASLPDGLASRLTDIGVLTDDLPAGANVTDAVVQDDGLRVTLRVDDVALEDL